MRISGLLFPILFLVGCSFVDSTRSTEWYAARAVAHTVEVAMVASDGVTFDYTGNTPSGCYFFDRVEWSREGNTIAVGVQVRTDDRLCITIVGWVQELITIPVPSAGTYLFVFERPEELGQLEVEVEVPAG
jgi:hypothetical protein